MDAMTEDTRKGWLQALKAGDPVALEKSYGRVRDYKLVRIERVTPTQLLIDARYYYRKNGSLVGDSFPPTRIVPQTAEVVEAVRRQTLLKRLGGVKWTDYPNEVLHKVVQAIETV
jgi:hypothetical protein